MSSKNVHGKSKFFRFFSVTGLQIELIEECAVFAVENRFLSFSLRLLPTELGQRLLGFYRDWLLRQWPGYYRLCGGVGCQGPIIVLAGLFFRLFLLCASGICIYVRVQEAVKELN